MKKKKIITENPNIALPDRKNGRLIRYRQKLEKEQKEREKRRNALFRKRVNSASEKKAPGTVRTKAYYRFSSEYPSTVSPDGFRENVPIKESMSGRTKAIVALLCVFVFIFTLIAVYCCPVVSRKKKFPTPLSLKSRKSMYAFFQQRISAEKQLLRLKRKLKQTDSMQFLWNSRVNTAMFILMPVPLSVLRLTD